MDRSRRQAILEKLKHTLGHAGPKALVGNKGFARSLRVSRDAVTIDEKAAEADARLDGKLVLRTSP